MSQSEQINELAAALAKAQGAMSNAVMNRTNPHFKSKYADLSSVLDASRAPLSANGLSVVQTIQNSERGPFLRTVLMHSSGQFISSEYALPNTPRPHEMGSALTYARRYSLAAMICNSSDEDDDGNAAQDTKPSKPHGNGHAKEATGPITDDELAQLRTAADEVGADIAKLCRYLKVDALTEITSDMLPNVYAALSAKRSKS